MELSADHDFINIFRGTAKESLMRSRQLSTIPVKNMSATEWLAMRLVALFLSPRLSTSNFPIPSESQNPYPIVSISFPFYLFTCCPKVLQDLG